MFSVKYPNIGCRAMGNTELQLSSKPIGSGAADTKQLNSGHGDWTNNLVLNLNDTGNKYPKAIAY